MDIARDPWNLDRAVEIRFTSSSKHHRASADAELPLPVVRAPDLSGRVLGQRYNLRRRIGGGSMGTVYEARDMTLGTAVAVKVLHPDYCGDEDFRRRFHQEARLGARLRHEHSVAVTDLGQSDDGLLYSVMEYLEGESLDALLESRPGPLPWRRVVTIAVQVCAALQAAHDRGVIHRDLKPANCFCIDRGGRDFIKILDFGLAKLTRDAGPDLTLQSELVGTLWYMAPEQLIGEPIDVRVDVYAAGVILFELLTGAPPFAAFNRTELMHQMLTSEAPTLRSVAPELVFPAGLEEVVDAPGGGVGRAEAGDGGVGERVVVRAGFAGNGHATFLGGADQVQRRLVGVARGDLQNDLPRGAGGRRAAAAARVRPATRSCAGTRDPSGSRPSTPWCRRATGRCRWGPPPGGRPR